MRTWALRRGLVFGGNGTGILQMTENVTSARSITLTQNGTLDTKNVGGGSSQLNTFSGVVSGSGSLTKTGGGSLTLSATNTYTGGTIIDDGQIVISRDDNLGAANGAIKFTNRNLGHLQFAGDVSSDVLSSLTVWRRLTQMATMEALAVLFRALAS